jgi:hypothetical protein
VRGEPGHVSAILNKLQAQLLQRLLVLQTGDEADAMSAPLQCHREGKLRQKLSPACRVDYQYPAVLVSHRLTFQRHNAKQGAPPAAILILSDFPARRHCCAAAATCGQSGDFLPFTSGA